MKNRILNTKLLDNQLALFYLGQEGYIIKFKDTTILIDGYFSGELNPQSPFGRRYLPPMDPKDLTIIDYVFCSHDHADHLDPLTIQTILEVNDKAKFMGSLPVRNHMKNLGVPEDRIIDASCDKEVSLKNVTVTPIPAAHEELHKNEEDFDEWGFIFDFDGFKIYHSGDCCPYDGLKERLTDVDITMLPVNGRDYYRLKNNIIGNFNLDEAVIMSTELNVRMFIPMHFDLFPGNSVPASFISERMEKNEKKIPYHIFQPGERLIISTD